MQRPIKIFNGKIITPGRIIDGGFVLVDGSHITAIGERNPDIENAMEIDACGKYVSPGFIDIHVHGGGGCDFMDGSETAFLKIAEIHARYGTTAMMPTTLTSTKQAMLQTLAVYEAANRNNKQGAQFIGMHLEGPYFAMNQRGAQDPRYIRDPDPAEYKELLERSSCIRRWSVAPELNGAIEMGKYLRSKNVLASVAHTDAIHEDVAIAFKNGYSLITHLYSGMSGVTRRNAFRYAGVVESAFLIDEMDVEIIADGVHLPAPLLQLVYKIKGPSRIALITDAMRAAGTDVKESMLGNIGQGLKVIIEDGVAKLPDRTAFAGSIATAGRLVNTMVKMADVPLTDAVQMMSATPARIAGISADKGSLEIGKDADIIIFDNNIEVSMTMVNGRILHHQSNGERENSN